MLATRYVAVLRLAVLGHGSCRSYVPQQLFKVQLMAEGEVWDSTYGKALVRNIPDFAVGEDGGNNTIVMHGHMTSEFTTFMLNLTPDGAVRVQRWLQLAACD